MNIDPKLIEQWASEWTTFDALKRRHYIAQRAAEYGAQQERERLLTGCCDTGNAKRALSKLCAAQMCHPNAVQHLIAEAIELLDDHVDAIAAAEGSSHE